MVSVADVSLQVEYRAVDALIPCARNARTHTEAQVAQIAASIGEFGFTNPVLIDGGGGVIAGHGRLLAAALLGMATVPCIKLGHLSEAQRRAYVIADNQLALKTRPVLTYSVYMWSHEPCFFGWLKGHKPKVNRTDGYLRTVWDIPSSEVESKDHPTSKPVRIFAIPMELHTEAGDLCYEPFMGSGSQLIAAEKTGRRCYGLELSPLYCDVIIRRWQDFTGKDATLEGDGRTFDEVAQLRAAA